MAPAIEKSSLRSLDKSRGLKSAALPDPNPQAIASSDLRIIAAGVRERTSLQENPKLPSGLNDTQRQYLEAVRDNRLAQLKHAQALEKAKGTARQDSKSRTQASRSALNDHLDLLRQQKLQQKLVVLGKYVGEVDSLAIAPAPPPEAKGFVPDAGHDTSGANTDLVHLHTHLQELIHKLEYAVVESDSRAKHEKALLDAVRESVDDKIKTNTVAQLHALAAVRDELTAWMEESLATCATSLDADQVVQPEVSSATIESIQQQYDQYVEARRILLQTVSAQPHVPGTIERKEPPVERVGQRIPDDESLTVENHSLLQQSTKGIKQVHQRALHDIEAEKGQATEALLRLADESQLLPQYPMLSKSDKFSKITEHFGSRPTGPADDKVLGQVESWAFAAEAAKDVTSTSVKTKLGPADAALNEFEETLRELRLLHED